jgi:uncharacterized protein (TIGR00297 family)
MQNNNSLLTRKSVHFVTGCMIIAFSCIVEREILLLLFIAGASFSFFTFNYKKFYSLHKTSYSSLGTLFYPLGVISSFLVLYDQPGYYFRTVILVLTISDVIAWLAGQINTFNVSFRISNDRKSLFGILAFSISCMMILHLYLASFIEASLSFILLATVVSVALEVISFKGSDNLTIPLGLSLFFLFSQWQSLNPYWLIAVILVPAAGCILLFKLNILTRSGSLSAYLLAVYFMGVTDFIWVIPVLFFFISSVLFTKLNASLSKEAGSSYRRNAWQVLANIIWALLCSVLFLITHDEIFIFFFIALIAAVTADTWASELGPLINRKSFSVADFKMHPAGFTGGISPGGTMAAMVASVCVSVISYYLFFGELHAITIAMLSVSGFLACFADTLLGAFAEKAFMKWRFLSQDGEGLSPNDLVNIAGSATGPLFFVILSAIG